MSGQCNHFDGVVYLPNGSYRTSGEGNGNDHAGGSCGVSPSNTYAGGIIAYGINVSGNWNLHRGRRCRMAGAALTSRTRSPLLGRATP